ncbi:MAG: carboxy-S-adenosyl-L-methionine synthase CmoA [Pseudohongiellaceae bacterium]
MSNANLNKDQIFAEQIAPSDFAFDDKVAGVFDDMINRSVPGYSTIINMIGILAQRYSQEGSNLYDLGCSLGGASFAMANTLDKKDCSIYAIDNSQAMISRLSERVVKDTKLDQLIHCKHDDILLAPLDRASVVVLNFTLQFIPLADRVSLLEKIYAGMTPGALLIISEKIVFPDEKLNELFIEMYHSFKESMGYSKLEISQKRTALENVLLPESLNVHRERLQSIGFHSFDAWFQCFNFASMVAFK